MNGSEPVLANQENAILAFNAAFNAEQVMKRSDLNDMFGSIMSSAAGFSPNIMAVPKAEFENPNRICTQSQIQRRIGKRRS